MRLKQIAKAVALGVGILLCALILVGFLLMPMFAPRAHARDSGQWADQDTAIAAWFATVKMPDNPTMSCCGEADAYWADQVETAEDGSLIAIITDDRPDGPLRRMHVPVGTRIPIPANKITWKHGNPTGHIVIFLSMERQVWCFVQNGGV